MDIRKYDLWNGYWTFSRSLFKNRRKEGHFIVQVDTRAGHIPLHKLQLGEGEETVKIDVWVDSYIEERPQ